MLEHSAFAEHAVPFTLMHEPANPLTLHLLPAGHVEEVQHTPSTHDRPLAHGNDAEHPAPAAPGSPQLPAMHAYPLTQSAVVVHDALHDVAPHTYGEHPRVVLVQLPAPSHVPTRVSVPPVQPFDPHAVAVLG